MGCGCSFKLAVIIFIILIALFFISFLSGALGTALLGGEILPSFLTVPKPHPKLPAEAIFHISSFPITNSMLAAWLTMAVLAGLAFAATRRMKVIPGKLQNIMETIVEMLLNFVEGVTGKENGRRFFPVIATIFLFVIMNAWLSLLPGFGSILVKTTEGEAHLLRGANTDINVTLALALVSFIMVEYWGITSQGFLKYMKKFINFSRLFRGLKQIIKGKIKSAVSDLFSGFIDVFVGVLEGVSELIRLVSFTFRLFGNMTAGEILLLVVLFLVPWVMPLPFYGLELLVGFVQALIFGGLTLVFATIAVTPLHGEHE